MVTVIKQLKEDQVYPCLIYFLKKNPHFNKPYTLADVEKPSEETWRHCMSNLMTLGRQLPEYEEWAQSAMDTELERLQSLSRCEFSLEKMVVESFEDIAKAKEVFGFVRYASSEMDEYFGVGSHAPIVEKRVV